MKVQSVNENLHNVHNGTCYNSRYGIIYNSVNKQNQVSFKSNSNFSKKSWLIFRQLSDYMKDKSELTSAWIAFIGTGGIAPFAIMLSPSKSKTKYKHEISEEEKENAKAKKFFQAIRQPISAFLAFCFQLPTTLGIAKLFDYFAYKNPKKVFKDPVIGNLVPDKGYLKKLAKKILSGKADAKLKSEWAEELKIAEDSEKITTELMNKLKQGYEEVGISISDEKLRKMANKKSRRNKFIAEKMADAKHKKLIDEKVASLDHDKFKINDLDLVTEDYQNLAKHRYKEEFKALEKDTKLNWADKFIKSMGFSNKKLKNLSDKEKNLAKEKGLILLQQDNPGILTDKTAKFKKFVETKCASAQKLYGNKVFWFTLISNLFMVAVSCTALNWLHPKFASFIDGIKLAKREEKERQSASIKSINSVNSAENVETRKVKVSA